MLTLWGTVFILSLITPIAMNPDILGANMTFFILSSTQFIACFYIYFLMKETSGLSDREKKSLYYPTLNK